MLLACRITLPYIFHKRTQCAFTLTFRLSYYDRASLTFGHEAIGLMLLWDNSSEVVLTSISYSIARMPKQKVFTE